MDKDGLSSVALIGLLLAIIITALYVRNANELVATRISYDQVVGGLFDSLSGVVANTETNGTPTTTPEPTSKPTATQKEAWQADPIPKIATEIQTKFQAELTANSLSSTTYINDQLWWRSDAEDYRILVKNAQVFGVQVPTTEAAKQKVPQSENDDHPALTHPLLAKVAKEISKQMSDLGFKRASFKNCPVNEAYDPFNNCVYTYTLESLKCSLIAVYGRIDKKPDLQPYLRLELACSSDYDQAYANAIPYLLTLNLINPDWRVPDMAVYAIQNYGDWSRVNFGHQYGIFRTIPGGYRLVTGGYLPPTCTLVNTESIPQAIYQECR
jgi:hypothetical protein